MGTPYQYRVILYLCKENNPLKVPGRHIFMKLNRRIRKSCIDQKNLQFEYLVIQAIDPIKAWYDVKCNMYVSYWLNNII